MVGGGEHSFFDLVTHLSEEWEQIILVPDRGELADNFMKKGLKTCVVSIARLRPWLLMNVFKSVRAYYRLCRRHNISLIYANGSRAALYGGIVGKMLHLPVVWHCRVSSKDPYLDTFLARLCTRIVANSRATVARFAERCPAKVEVIYNGIDLAWLNAPEITSHNHTVLYMPWNGKKLTAKRCSK